MDEAEPIVKVTDRRHFTAEGDVREDAPSESPVEAAEARPEARSEAEPESAPDGAEAPPVTFSSFVISLAAQAADFIGGEHRNLGAARQVISAIEMLKDKTEGRRTEDESRIIDALLFDLRLAFVGSAKGPKS